MTKRVEIAGQKFNRWQVISYTGNRQGHSFYLCRCDCGTTKEVSGNYLRRGSSKSCGCYDAELKRARSAMFKKTNPNRLAIASVHHGMMLRCYKESLLAYKDYGGRGIVVCDEWHTPANFRKWANENGFKPGLQLDRIDNDGDYTPTNCQFVTVKENANKKRNTRWIVINGQKMTMSQIADRIGKPYGWVKTKLRTKNGLHILENEVEEAA